MSAEGTTEWRADISDELFQAADALCRAYGISRREWTEKWFAAAVNDIAHKHMLFQRVAKGNALLSEPSAPPSEKKFGIGL